MLRCAGACAAVCAPALIAAPMAGCPVFALWATSADGRLSLLGLMFVIGVVVVATLIIAPAIALTCCKADPHAYVPFEPANPSSAALERSGGDLSMLRSRSVMLGEAKEGWWVGSSNSNGHESDWVEDDCGGGWGTTACPRKRWEQAQGGARKEQSDRSPPSSPCSSTHTLVVNYSEELSSGYDTEREESGRRKHPSDRARVMDCLPEEEGA